MQETILADYLNKIKPLHSIPGVSLGIKDGKLNEELIIYNGYVDSNETSKKIDKDTRFDIASITKLFTALQMLKMYEQDLFDIYKPVNSYIDIETLDMDVVSLASFNHKLVTNGRIDEDLPLQEIKRRIKKLKVAQKDTFVYSDIPYILLGYSIPNRLEYFRQIFNEDLSLITAYTCNGNPTGGSYRHLNEVHDPKAKILEKYGFFPAHAGLYSTSEDLLKLFNKMHDSFLNNSSIDILLLKISLVQLYIKMANP